MRSQVRGTRRVEGESPTFSPSTLHVPRTWGHTAVALTATLAVGALAGCTSREPTDNGPATAAGVSISTGPDPTVAYRNPYAVCRAFTAVLLTVGTHRDGSRSDSLRRTGPYVTPALLERVPPGGGDPQWQEWAEHEVHTEVLITAYAGDAGANGSGVSDSAADDVGTHAVWLAAVTPVGRDGWRGPVASYAVHCVLTHVGDGGLRVAEYELEPLGL